MATTTEHLSGVGQVLFMAAARPMKTDEGTDEFTIKVRFAETDPVIVHLKEISPKKLDTKTNRGMEGTGELIVSFSSQFAPKVFGLDNRELTGREIPFFDGRKDKATAAVSYKVIDYGKKVVVRLSGIKLVSLDQAPREEGGVSTSDILNKLKEIG